MSSLFGIGAGSGTGFYNGIATQSLKFNDDDSAFLSRTPSSATNRKTFTWSGWVKRGNISLSNSQILFSARTVGNSTYSILFLEGTNDNLYFLDNNCSLKASNKLRDVSAWYHIVLAVDTTQATASNRVKFYINGTQVTDFDVTTYPSQDTDFNVNSTATHFIGKQENQQYFDGYMAEVNLVDGFQYDHTYFGETKNGVWIPKAYSGSYGTNGFRLNFKGTGTATSSGAVSSPTNIGDDSSGQNNHFAVSGFTTTDSNLNDSPENNHATLNPLQAVVNDTSTKPTLSEGNLVMTTSTADYQGFSSTMAIPTEGKYAFKVKMNTESSTQTHRFGVGTSIGGNGISTGTSGGASSWHNAVVFLATVPRIDTCKNGTYSAGSTLSPATVAGDEIEFLVDMDNGTIDTKLNGSAYGTQITGMPTDKPLFPFGTVYETLSSTSTLTFTFDYTPSDSNYLSICSANLPEPTISPNATTQAVDHHGTLTYTSDGNAVNIVSGGNDNNSTAIGGEIDFSPDWVWIKRRNADNNHQVFDTIRGSNVLVPNENGNQSDYSSYFLFNDTNGFRLPATSANMNASGGTFVAWNWLAGGNSPTKTYKVKVVADSTDYGHGTGSNKYQFFKSDGTTGFGTNGVDIDLMEGGTYTFDWSHSSAQGHPIRFSLTNDGTHSSGTSAGSEYTTGVVKDDSGYKTTITIQSGVASLYLYCANHSGMGFEIRTNSTAGSTNFDGSITSIVNANTTSGFSIVKATSPSSGTWTVGHGLNSTPTWIIQKYLASSSRWTVWNNFLTSGQYLGLNESNQALSSGTPFNYTFTDSVIGGNSNYDATSTDVIYYVFHDVEGYFKSGLYVGNGTTGTEDGAYVYTGFRPAWVLIKPTSGSGDWELIDSVREPYNELSASKLEPNNNGQESTRVNDFFSNGFKVSGNGNTNASGVTYSYVAFAEVPYKYANAR